MAVPSYGAIYPSNYTPYSWSNRLPMAQYAAPTSAPAPAPASYWSASMNPWAANPTPTFQHPTSSHAQPQPPAPSMSKYSYPTLPLSMTAGYSYSYAATPAAPANFGAPQFASGSFAFPGPQYNPQYTNPMPMPQTFAPTAMPWTQPSYSVQPPQAPSVTVLDMSRPGAVPTTFTPTRSFAPLFGGAAPTATRGRTLSLPQGPCANGSCAPPAVSSAQPWQSLDVDSRRTARSLSAPLSNTDLPGFNVSALVPAADNHNYDHLRGENAQLKLELARLRLDVDALTAHVRSPGPGPRGPPPPGMRPGPRPDPQRSLPPGPPPPGYPGPRPDPQRSPARPNPPHPPQRGPNAPPLVARRQSLVGEGPASSPPYPASGSTSPPSPIQIPLGLEIDRYHPEQHRLSPQGPQGPPKPKPKPGPNPRLSGPNGDYVLKPIPFH